MPQSQAHQHEHHTAPAHGKQYPVSPFPPLGGEAQRPLPPRRLRPFRHEQHAHRKTHQPRGTLGQNQRTHVLPLTGNGAGEHHARHEVDHRDHSGLGRQFLVPSVPEAANGDDSLGRQAGLTAGSWTPWPAVTSRGSLRRVPLG